MFDLLLGWLAGWLVGSLVGWMVGWLGWVGLGWAGLGWVGLGWLAGWLLGWLFAAGFRETAVGGSQQVANGRTCQFLQVCGSGKKEENEGPSVQALQSETAARAKQQRDGVAKPSDG